MSTYDSSNIAFFLIDGYSVLGQTTDLSDKVTATIEDTTPLGAAWMVNRFNNLRKYDITQKGFFDDATNSVNDALAGKIGTTRTLCFGYETNTTGKQFVGASGPVESDYERVSVVGKVHRANATYAAAGAIENGVILHGLGAETAAGNTSATDVDNAASSANGGAAYLQLTALTLGGFTNVIVKVQESVDNITYVDLATFTAVTAAPAAQRIAVTGTVDRYLDVAWSFTGSGSGESVTFMSGFARA